MQQQKLPCCHAERQRRISAKRWIFFSHLSIPSLMIAASAVPSYSLRSASNRPPVPEMRDEAR
jgi:hypothetical protein